jgi:DNA-binding protein HU-beta
MTKAEVVDLVAEKTGISRQQAYDSVELFLKCIKQALKKGEKVSLVGFGTFLLKKKNARKGRNPRTGEKITIPRKRIPTFKPGKSFRIAVAKSS